MLARNTWYCRHDQRGGGVGWSSAEVPGGVHGNAGRDRAEEHQEKARERIEAQVERQVGQPEWQRHGLRRHPHRLQAEGRERDSGNGAERKRDVPRERGVARGNQSQRRDDEPENCDQQRACER